MRPQAIPSLANFTEFVMQIIAAILYNVWIKFNIIKFDRQQVYVIQYVTASNCKPFSFRVCYAAHSAVAWNWFYRATKDIYIIYSNLRIKINTIKFDRQSVCVVQYANTFCGISIGVTSSTQIGGTKPGITELWNPTSHNPSHWSLPYQ